uniref:Protein Wnt n=1 Tax=Timema genevievae TaxID=629358 RepID=A0A7R9K531_TIMGE|nr:unnamed protein product [Timema genevievae]
MQCRCHGISGSCELKTCWRTMPSFSEIGDMLKRKYKHAVQVSPKMRRRLRRKSKRRLPFGKGDLVHIHKSPNFCLHDPEKGILGTSGRECNKTSIGSDSCSLLCCGRGYNTQVRKTHKTNWTHSILDQSFTLEEPTPLVLKHVERCHCKFVWCCYVKCKTCETQIDIHTCK